MKSLNQSLLLLILLLTVPVLLLTSCRGDKEDDLISIPDLIVSIEITGDEERTISYTNFENGIETGHTFIAFHKESSNIVSLDGKGTDYSWSVGSINAQLYPIPYSVNMARLTVDDGETKYDQVVSGNITFTEVGPYEAVIETGGYQIVSGTYTAILTNQEGGSVTMNASFKNLLVTVSLD